jgi:hypothetical protein
MELYSHTNPSYVVTSAGYLQLQGFSPILLQENKKKHLGPKKTWTRNSTNAVTKFPLS